ncbi:MAG: chemotaxis protein CheW [Gammaproteobacteria bacterium]|nr:chemotaxis protein CheW [Gammaproteobacteria bacterium]
MQASSTHPLLILKEIDSACRKIIGKNTKPVQFDENTWSGIGFRIFNDELVIQNIYINEILNANFQNRLSRVPGAKPWFLGLISLRGQPLPVIDLKQYFFNEASKPTENSRLIVIKHKAHISGLLLEQVHGLKQFPVDVENTEETEKTDTKSVDDKNAGNKRTGNINTGNKSSDIDPKLRHFVDRIFVDQGQVYGNLSISRLTNDKDFANAAR